MDEESAILSAGAVALSTAATLSAVIVLLKRKGAFSEEEEREMYEMALMMLEGNQGDDGSGVFKLARDLIEQHLIPTSS